MKGQQATAALDGATCESEPGCCVVRVDDHVAQGRSGHEGCRIAGGQRTISLQPARPDGQLLLDVAAP